MFHQTLELFRLLERLIGKMWRKLICKIKKHARPDWYKDGGRYIKWESYCCIRCGKYLGDTKGDENDG